MAYTEPGLVAALAAGELRFAYGISPPWLLLLAVLLLAGVWLSYRGPAGPAGTAWKVFFISLRSGVLLLVLFCLLRPVVTTRQVVPQETYLAVLFDDSRSMGITDMPGATSRHGAVEDALRKEGVLEQLGSLFQVRSFRFGRRTEGMGDSTDLAASQTASNIHQALESIDRQLGGLPLAAVVLVSDGADNSGLDPLARAEDFASRQIPLFTVGVGQEAIPRDIGIVDISARRTLLDTSVFTVSVGLQQRGYEGQEVQLVVRDGEQVAYREQLTLGPDGATTRHELQLRPSRQEAVAYGLEVQLQDGEIIEQNNRSSFLVDNREQPPLDILYLEGHPRNEYKFIRRAVESDASLRLVTYLQTGPEKYYRQGIQSPAELREGFPPDRETLFRYEALLLGDIAPEFFAAGQLQMIRAFVAERGGGLLLSGMIDEGFIATPLADMLPVTLVEEQGLPPHLRGGIRRGNHPTGELFYPRRTGSGEFSPLLQLDRDGRANRLLWQQLPPLQGVHVTGRSKPGAVVLLEHPLLQYRNQALPVLAWQRYGSGRSMAMTTASTWRWQMMMPHQDQSHEILWRQLLKWLAVSAPGRISIELDRESYEVGDEVTVTATWLDGSYQPDNHASLYLQITDPLAAVTDQPMAWDLAADGVYRASFPAREQGVYRLLVEVASAAGEGHAGGAQQQAALLVTQARREYRDAPMNRDLLQRLAATGAGRFLALDEVGQLVDSLRYTPNALSREVAVDLWDQPWVLALLLALLCIHWIARRIRGLS